VRFVAVCVGASGEAGVTAAPNPSKIRAGLPKRVAAVRCEFAACATGVRCVARCRESVPTLRSDQMLTRLVRVAGHRRVQLCRGHPDLIWRRAPLLEVERVQFTVRSKSTKAPSTGCGSPSDRNHRAHKRTLRDPPLHGRQVVVHLRVRRFHCAESSCSRRTFAEPVRRRARQLPSVSRGDVRRLSAGLPNTGHPTGR
jgi:hypothetical protein